MSVLRLSLLCCLCLLTAAAEEGAAEDGAGKGGKDGTAAESQELATDSAGLPTREPFAFKPLPYENRRDIFFRLTDAMKAERQIQKLVEKARAGPLTGPQDGSDDGSSVTEMTRKLAESQALGYVEKVKVKMINENWDGVISDCDQHIQDVKLLIDQFPDSRRLQQVVTLLRHHRTQAEEKKRYEEARAAFLALGIRVEGIIWSAEDDLPSLVVIRGQPIARGVGDRIHQNCEIINVDPSRVDFIFNYRRRKYHFQLYLEP